MTLVMFDVDGTLTESFDLDSVTYRDALCEVFGFRDVSDDWATYRHVTDSGILAEIFEARLGRLPTPAETERMRTHFAALLTERIETAGGLRPIAGAVEILARLLDSADKYVVAYASGGWVATARLKLRRAGLPVDEIPGAFSDDDHSREGICRVSRQRAEKAASSELTTVVYFGDGVWDVRTSRRLGYGFIGIGRGTGAAKLRSEGALEILPDYGDAEAFFAAVERAAATANPVLLRRAEIMEPGR